MGKKSSKKKPLDQARLHSKTEHLHVKAEKKSPARLKLALLLGLLSFIIYANTLKNSYAVDDVAVITSNTLITKGISAIPEILSTSYRAGFAAGTNDLYRPLSLVMFAVEYQVFNGSPTPGHFFNVIFFCGCVILLFLFIDDFFERKKTIVAFITALLFAFHPIHTEVVANIKSRDEIMCFFFVFLSLNIFMKYLQNGKMLSLAIGAFCFFLSLLSKETTFTFLAIIPVIFFFYRNENKKRSVHITGSITLMALICLSIRFLIFNNTHAHFNTVDFADNPLALASLSPGSRIATAILILGYYVKLLFIPYPLIWDYSYNTIPFVNFTDPRVLLSAAIYLAFAFFSIRSLIKKDKNPFAFGIILFLVPISIFSNIPFLIGSAMGERFLFFPSIGFCMAIALFVEKWLGAAKENVNTFFQTKQFLVVVLPLSIIYFGITFERNSEWADNYTLYSSDLKKAPDGAKVTYFAGREIILKGDNEKDPAAKEKYYKEAIPYMYKTLSILSDYEPAETQLAVIFFNLSRFDSSEYHGKRSVQLNPNQSYVLSNLGSACYSEQKFTEAIGFYKRAVSLNPGDAASFAFIGLSFMRMGNNDSAIIYSRKAIAVNPVLNASYEIMASSYKNIGNADSSKKYEAIAKKGNPRFQM